MDNTEQLLQQETLKWLNKIKQETIQRSVDTKEAREIEKNLRAYIEDTTYFLEKKDFLRAFEAVVYAWGILETGHMAGIFSI